MSGIPKSFLPFLSTFSDFSRKKVKVNVVGKDTASPNDFTSILLPEGKLALDTFTLGGLATVTTTAGFARLPPCEMLIEQIMIEVGSTQLHPSFNYYPYVWSMFSDLQGTWLKSGIRAINKLQPIDATAPATSNPTNSPFQIADWLGFLSSVRILNSDRCPPIRVLIRWSGNNVFMTRSARVGRQF
jgi:hypothetical protein